MSIQPVPRERITLEICIASVADALAAQDGGADRIELNAALALGGLTPSAGMLCEVRQAVSLPLVVMIRPRAGGFYYTPAEFAVMQRDLEAALAQGADGVAFGALHADGRIDLLRCHRLIQLARGRQTVCHRAFDFVPGRLTALNQLIELGVTRVMTSGRQETALAGAALLRQLVEHAAGRIEILPAGRINASNVTELLSRTGCRQVHAAVRRVESDIETVANLPSDSMRAFEATCPQAVKDLRAALDAG